MKRIKRERKKRTSHRAVKQKKIKLHVRKSAHKPHREHFIQKELFESVPAVEETKIPKKSKIYALFIIIVLILILLLIKFISGSKSEATIKKSSTVVSSPEAVTTQQVVVEKTEPAISKEVKPIIIYFPSNKWEVKDLSETEQNKLSSLVAGFLNNKPEQKLIIYGYADRTGLRSYNLTVSEKRAKNIADFFMQNAGIKQEKMDIQGKGEVLEGPDGVVNPLFRKVEIIRK